jgi:hypothetical protein
MSADRDSSDNDELYMESGPSGSELSDINDGEDLRSEVLHKAMQASSQRGKSKGRVASVHIALRD